MGQLNKKNSEAQNLSEIQKFYIEGNHQNETPEELASKLGVTVELVKSHINTIPKPKKQTRYDTLIGKHPRLKGVVIMNEQTSMLGDDLTKQRRPKTNTTMISEAPPEEAKKLREQRDTEIEEIAQKEIERNSDKWFKIGDGNGS